LWYIYTRTFLKGGFDVEG